MYISHSAKKKEKNFKVHITIQKNQVKQFCFFRVLLPVEVDVSVEATGVVDVTAAPYQIIIYINDKTSTSVLSKFTKEQINLLNVFGKSTKLVVVYS